MGRAPAQYQPDLFEGRGRSDAWVRPPDPPIPAIPKVETLPDDALTAALAEAGPTEIGAVCAEIAARSLKEAVPALEALWRRFAGFGIERPLAEQIAVLDTLARLDCPAARALLRRIVARGLSASLIPAGLHAAARAGLALPAGFVSPLLNHEDPAVRRSAFALAERARIPVEWLHVGLHDRSPATRRAAAVALAHRGDGSARETLLEELARSPSEALIHALAAIPDEDTIVHLGRCAVRNRALAPAVIDALRDMESRRAARLARRLERDLPGGP